MTIKEIDTILTCPGRNFLIVKITTQDGIVGYGDATLNGRELAVQSVIDNYLKSVLIGYDADRIEDIWQMVFKGTYWRGGPVLMTALSGIDMALWDIKGKRAGLPLYSIIGGKSRDKAMVYYHVHGRTDDELVERSYEVLKKGCRVLRYSFDTEDPFMKSRYFCQPHQDIELSRIEVKNVNENSEWDSDAYADDLIRVTKKLRENLGPNIGLIHDVHNRLSLAQACRVAKELEKCNLMFLEEPVDAMDKKALLALRQYTTTPIAMGELYNTIYDCEDVITKQCIDYIRVDISHFGGITAILKASSLAEVYGVKTAFHGPSDISPIAHSALVHIDFSRSNFGIQETVDIDEETGRVFKVPYRVENGYLLIDDKPGLGVEVDEEKAKQYTYDKKYLPILRDCMGSIHNW